MTEMASIFLLLAFVNHATAYTSVVTKINLAEEGHRRNDVNGIMLFEGNDDEESINKLLNIHAKVSRQVLAMILKHGGSFFMASSPKMEIDLPEYDTEMGENEKQSQEQSTRALFPTKLLANSSNTGDDSEARVTPSDSDRIKPINGGSTRIYLPYSESGGQDENYAESKISSVGSGHEIEENFRHGIKTFNEFLTQDDKQNVRSVRQSVYRPKSLKTPISSQDVISKNENDGEPREETNSITQIGKNNTLDNAVHSSNKLGGEAEYHYDNTETEKSLYANHSGNGNQSHTSDTHPNIVISTEEVKRESDSNFGHQPLSPVTNSSNEDESAKEYAELVPKQNGGEKISNQPRMSESSTHNAAEGGSRNVSNLSQDINHSAHTEESSINKAHDYNSLSNNISVKINPISLIYKNNCISALNNDSHNDNYLGNNFIPSDKFVNTLTKNETLAHVDTRPYNGSPSIDLKVELQSEPVFDSASQESHHSATPNMKVKFHALEGDTDFENKSFSSLERTRRDKKSRPSKNAVYRVRFKATIEQRGSGKSGRKRKMNGKHKKGKSSKKCDKKKSSSKSRSSKGKKEKCKKRKSDSRRSRQ